MAYAERTKVPVTQTKGDIERILTKYGATGFLSGQMNDQAIVGFVMQGRQVRFFLPLPVQADFGTLQQFEQEQRRRWRSLLLCIKAKLEIVETGITDFEEEFLAHIVTPDGSTFGQHAKLAIASAYETGRMPPLLPAPTTEDRS